MTVMRTLVAERVGEPAEVLRLESRPVPRPGPGEALVRVLAAPVHASDLHIARGRYGLSPDFPTVLGMECVGRVTELGPGADGFEVGDRVITVGRPGTWQDYLTVGTGQLLPVPDHLSDTTAAQLVANPLTALLLVRELGPQPGEWLMQTAAGSTVGKLVIQLAHHYGFRTINLVRRRSAVAEIEALGGEEVICTEDEDIRERVAQIAGEAGVSKALDCVSGQLGADVSRVLAPGGQTLVYGALATHRQTAPERLTTPLFARSLIYEAKTVRGFWLFHWFTTTPHEQVREMLGEVRDLVSDGILTIPEGMPFAPEDVTKAAVHAEAPGHGAKPVLVFQ